MSHKQSKALRSTMTTDVKERWYDRIEHKVMFKGLRIQIALNLNCGRSIYQKMKRQMTRRINRLRSN